MASENRKKIESMLEEATQELSTSRGTLPDHLYTVFEGLCSVFYAWRQSNGEPGWAKRLEKSEGVPLFTDEEAAQVENGFQTISPYLESQGLGSKKLHTGGAMPAMPAVPAGPKLPDLIPSASFQVPAGLEMDPKDISIDAAYFLFQNKLNQLQTQWKEISNGMGILQKVEKTDDGKDIKGRIYGPPPVPPTGIPYIIPRRIIFPLISYTIEFIRFILAALPGDRGSSMGVFMSLLQFIVDTLRGNFNQAMMSLAGLFSKTGMRISVVGRLFVNIADFVSPELRKRLSLDIYQTGKSILAGSVLWLYVTIAPDELRQSTVDLFNEIRKTVDGINPKLTTFGQELQSVAAAAGKEFHIETISENSLPTLDDIQNLQMLLHVPEINCSREFRAIVDPLIENPPLRLVLDLMNIPTVPEHIEDVCAGISSLSFAEMAKKWATDRRAQVDGMVVSAEMDAAEAAAKSTGSDV
jgi:hypothetical protein